MVIMCTIVLKVRGLGEEVVESIALIPWKGLLKP